ncbi:MAG: hypothetical protein NDJ89_12715 [Oligoflexia bacterium]|nr:hypothetical protein [Oligoflexia bacterium]
MRGVFFQKPREFVLEVEGESWRQGEQIRGTLTIRDHGASAPAPARVLLAEGALKKVRERSPEAFEVLASAVTKPGETVFSWSFPLARDFPITENTSSPFLLYGTSEAPPELGQLQLNIRPHEVIEQFLDTLRVHFRFVQKSRRSSKGWVDVRLSPPDARNLGMLEYLVLGLRLDESEALELRYQFQLKKIEATAAAFDVKKLRKIAESRIESHEYRLPSGRFQHERFEADIRKALDPIESRLLH